MPALCKLGNHVIEDVMHRWELCSYTDIENGVPENTSACPDCYLAHLQKYYPNSYATIELTRRAEAERLSAK